jgi:hypothetical protein
MKDRVINDSVNRITQGYNPPRHNGVDLGWRSDESQNRVFSNSKGKVVRVVTGIPPMPASSGSYGNYVKIDHYNGMYSLYAHLRRVNVKEGQEVDENTQIGVIGESGATIDSQGIAERHLHFEVFNGGTKINPTPYLTQSIYNGSPSPTPTPGKQVNVYYRVKTEANGWLPEVRNLDDYAGYNDSPITGVAIRVDKGRVEYQVHTMNGRWLSKVSGCNINDYLNGYAGDGNVIDCIKIYYYTPDDIRPYKKAKYKVNNYSWQYDTETGGGQDGFAGNYGYSMKKLWIEIV